MIPLTAATSWLLMGSLIVAGVLAAVYVERWLDETDARSDLASLDRHHGARAACSRVGQAATHDVVPPQGSAPCPTGQPYDWEIDV
jgi:hypothetical protein